MSVQGKTWDEIVRSGRLYIADWWVPKPSMFRNFKDLQENGWANIYTNTWIPEDASSRRMYDSLRISLKPSDNIKYMWMHKMASQPINPGPKYPPSNGLYSCVFNQKAIVVHDAESPAFRLQKDNRRGVLMTPLNHWSDVVFLQWRDFCVRKRYPVGGLQYVVQMNIVNDQTSNVLKHCLADEGRTELTEWHTRDYSDRQLGEFTFPFTHKRFSAIMGTINGCGVAHLLSQHMAEMGSLMVTAVPV